MEPLAAISDVEALGVDVSNVNLVTTLLGSVSAAVREAAGSPITQTSVTVTLPGQWDQSLPLPGAPISAVESVEMNGQALTDWKLRYGCRLWRANGWGHQGDDITITYTYGLATVPADIVKLVASLVAAGIHEAEDGVGERRGLANMRIDDYGEGYFRGDDELVDLTEIPERVKRSLRARFSGQTSVIETV